MKTLPAILDGILDLKDRSCSMRFVTRELNNKEFAELRDMRGFEGWLLFGQERMTKDDIPKGDPETGGKSPAQRMRAVLYLLWKQEGDGMNDKEYYESKMEMILQKLKNKLD